MNIKTWQERVYIGAEACDINEAMQAEIDELRAALKERDAAYMDGYEGGKQEARDAAHEEIDAQRKVLTQALEALNSLFSWEVDEQRGKRCTDAITAIQEQLA